MNKNIFVIGAGVVLIAGGAAVYAFTQQPNKMMEKSPAVMEKQAPSDEAMMKKDESQTEGMMKKDEVQPEAMMDSAMEKQGKYLPHTASALAENAQTKRVLFFYANWCPTCKAAQSSIQENLAQLPQNVTVIRVNYNDTETDDAEKALAKQYGITYQHTFVQIDESGKALTTWNGGDITDLRTNIQ